MVLVLEIVPGQVFLAMNRRGFCIFIDTICQGSIPSVRESKTDDSDESPGDICVFATELEAQREIADFMMTRLKEFIDGERDFEDVTTVEEYIMEVDVCPDGTIVDVDGNRLR